MASQPPSNGPYTALPANAANASGGIMPSAGHYADMQTLMQNLDALSGWLQQNREDIDGLTEGLRRVEGLGGRRAAAPQQEHVENGVEGEVADDAQTIASLRSELAESQQRIQSLESTLSSFQNLHTLFNSTLTDTMRLIRNYTYSQQTYTTSLHQHYTKLLQDARYETLEAQMTHQKWQEGLSRVSEKAREAIKARDEEIDAGGARAEIKGLRVENRLLRRKVGWEFRHDSDEDEQDVEGEEEDGAQARRIRASLGVAEAVAS